MGRRRTGRELALQLAYGLDQGGLKVGQVDYLLQRMPVLDDESVFDPIDAASPEEEEGPAPEHYFSSADWNRVRDFASWLVRGTWERLAEVDAAVAARAEHWKSERMPAVDRNILRLACFELLFSQDIPPKATINEWIEVAKKFSTELSGGFINGILDRIHKERQPGSKSAGGGAGS